MKYPVDILSQKAYVIYIIWYIVFLLWMGGGTRILRKRHGEPYSTCVALGISFICWIINWVFISVIFAIDTLGNTIGFPGLVSLLLFWWSYANLKEKYLRNCFIATGTPNERQYYADILDITLTMTRDEVINRYVSRKKTATTEEEQQKVELAYAFFIEPKKYKKLVKKNTQNN